MTQAKEILFEALNALLAEWQQIQKEERDGEASIQLRENIKKLLELIESLDKGVDL